MKTKTKVTIEIREEKHGNVYVRIEEPIKFWPWSKNYFHHSYAYKPTVEEAVTSACWEFVRTYPKSHKKIKTMIDLSSGKLNKEINL